MAVTRQMYEFLIEPLRAMDRLEGRRFLERWMQGPQENWERIDSLIISVPNIWSLTECPDRLLIYLKWIVGWTSALDYITQTLTADELRRLISVSVRLWKERGTESSILEVLFFTTAARCRIWNWFDFRWVLGEGALGEERDERGDPWLIPPPSDEQWGPEAYRPEYLSNLRIVDNGSLNRALVVNLMKLMRASGERWEITYLAFLDLFTNATDSTQWDISSGGAVTVADGHLTFGSIGGLNTISIIREFELYQLSITARVKMASDDLESNSDFGIILVDGTSTERYAMIIRADRIDTDNIALYWDSGSGLLEVDSVTIPEIPIRRNVYYSYRFVVTNEVDGRVRLQIFVDGNECLNLVDSQFMPDLFSGIVQIQLMTADTLAEVDEVEVLSLPIESDEINIS